MDENIRNTGSTTGTRNKVREKAAEVAGKAKDKLDSQYGAKQAQAVNEVQNLASALRNAAENVRRDGNGTISGTILTTVAERLESVGTSFSGKDLDGVVHDIERFARRSPAAFIGGAMLVGFAASRFLKSSGRGHGYDAGSDLTPYSSNFDSEFDRSFSAPATPGTPGAL